MNKSEISSLRKSIVNDEKLLMLPISDAVELADELKDKYIGADDVKIMGNVFKGNS